MPLRDAPIEESEMSSIAPTPRRQWLQIELGYKAITRDRIKVSLDLYIPNGPKKGSIVIGTPYDSRSPWVISLARELARSGYAVIVQNNRGRHGSEGEFRPFEKEREDTIDVLDWIAGQKWHNGKIGMFGVCYSVYTNYSVIGDTPPNVRIDAAVSCMELIDIYEMLYPCGALRLHWAFPWLQLITNTSSNITKSRPSAADRIKWEEVIHTLPLTLLGDRLGQNGALWKTWMTHPNYSGKWQKLSVERLLQGIGVPVLHISGWFDACLRQTLISFEQSSRGGSPQALIIGPWDHSNLIQALIFDALASRSQCAGGSTDYPLFRRVVDWFDLWLDGSGVENEGRIKRTPVDFFLMGDGSWYRRDQWPPPGIRWSKLYLGESGGLIGDHPTGGGFNSYIYDPADPMPTLGGDVIPYGQLLAGPIDQRRLNGRADCLTFTGELLQRPLAILGRPRAVLYVGTDAPDTDFVVKLTDVHPDGRSEIVRDGIFRMRYLESRSRPRPIQPGAIYRISVDLGNVAHYFKIGHRMRIVVSSSNFPKFDRNLNNQEYPETDSCPRIARQRVFWGGLHASFVHMPIADDIDCECGQRESPGNSERASR